MGKLMVVPWLSSLLITGKSTTRVFASVNGPSMSKFCKEQPLVVIKITATQSNFNPQSQFHSPKWVCQWCRPIHLSPLQWEIRWWTDEPANLVLPIWGCPKMEGYPKSSKGWMTMTWKLRTIWLCDLGLPHDFINPQSPQTGSVHHLGSSW